MPISDILNRFDGGEAGQALAALVTPGVDSLLLAPLATAGADNPSPTLSLEGAYYNAGLYNAFAPYSNGGTTLLVEFIALAAMGASATNIKFEVICAEDAGLTTNVNVLSSSGVFAKALFDAAATTNVPIYVPIPPVNTDLLTGTPIYFGVRYTATGSGGDYGTFTAKLVDHPGALAPSNFEDGSGYDPNL